jgi:hypothetical protein
MVCQHERKEDMTKKYKIKVSDIEACTRIIDGDPDGNEGLLPGTEQLFVVERVLPSAHSGCTTLQLADAVTGEVRVLTDLDNNSAFFIDLSGYAYEGREAPAALMAKLIRVGDSLADILALTFAGKWFADRDAFKRIDAFILDTNTTLREAVIAERFANEQGFGETLDMSNKEIAAVIQSRRETQNG